VTLARPREGADVRTNRIVAVIMIVLVATMAADLNAQRRGDSAPPRPPTVLFMCPHGAAKSVLASAYFERMAKERGLNVRVESAGTDPDPIVSPAVAAHLKRQGYAVPGSNPRKVTQKDFESADIVISIGCDLSGLQEPRGKLMLWDDVPAPSEDFARSDEAIRKRVTELIEELLRSAPKKK
jgi:arsenate reductase (thioredoxin)